MLIKYKFNREWRSIERDMGVKDKDGTLVRGFLLDDFSWRSWYGSSEGKFVVSEKDGVTYVCLRCVVSSLSL